MGSGTCPQKSSRVMVTKHPPRHGQKHLRVLWVGRGAGITFLGGHFKYKKQFHFWDSIQQKYITLKGYTCKNSCGSVAMLKPEW